MQTITNLSALLRHAAEFDSFLSWISTDGYRLVTAADLLGGSRWAVRAQKVVEAVSSGAELVTQREPLVALHSLLHLELMNDLESEEAARFAAVNPDDPRAEAVDQGLRALDALCL